MNRKILLMAALALGIQGIASAQTKYDMVQDQNFWDDGSNAAGMISSPLPDGVKAVSYAELFGSVSGGGFRASNEAKNPWSVGAVAKSEMHLSKLVLRGGFSFKQKEGTGMDGSMFINPGQYPLDVLEFTPGRKTLQTYTFDGSVAAKLTDRWTIGGKIDFLSSNYSKRKDIRHTNYALDITVAPSVIYSISEDYDIGLTYIFRKTSESVRAEKVGTATAESYYAFLDKGIGYGTYDVWDGSSLHLAESGVDRFPVKEIFNGAEVQFRAGDAYIDGSWLHSKGEVGEKGYTWYKFPGDRLAFHAGWRLSKPAALHLFRLGFYWKTQENKEYVVEQVTSGGITTPQVYGYNKIFERKEMVIEPEYHLYKDKFEIFAKATYADHRNQSSLVYPYLNSWNYSTLGADVLGIVHLGDFDVNLRIWGMDAVDNYEKSSSVESSQLPEEEPFRLDEWFLKDKEWKTAGRMGIDAALRYNFSIGSFSGLYVKPEGGFVFASGIDYLPGKYRWTAGLRIGCEF
jgi:hypothetical protein